MGGSGGGAAGELRDDERGDRVGLLRGQAPLLNRVVGDVPGTEHVLSAVDAAVSIDRQEPVLVLRQPVDRRAGEARERDREVDLDVASPGDATGGRARAARRGR